MKIFLLLLCCLPATLAELTPDGHLVASVEAFTKQHLEILQHALNFKPELDFWTLPRLHGKTQVMVPWSDFESLRKEWTEANMTVSVLHPDVQEMINKADERNRKARLSPGKAASQYGPTLLLHNAYLNYSSHYDEAYRLLGDYGNTNKIRFVEPSGGWPQSAEGRDIYYFELGLEAVSGQPDPPTIFFEVTIHAREWITTAANHYMVDWLLTNYASNNADARYVLNNFRLVIIPIVNPDGYVYSWSSSSTSRRLWRKNRRNYTYNGGSCIGVDLNRNYDYRWGPASGFCSSITFPGVYAASEPETQAVVNLFDQYSSNMVAYLSVHSFSEVLLLPPGYIATTNVATPLLREIAEAMANSMTQVGNNYTAGTVYDKLGVTAGGTTMDWALDKANQMGKYDTFMTTAYELRPGRHITSNAGFIISADQIIPTGIEYTQSVIRLARELCNRVLNNNCSG